MNSSVPRFHLGSICLALVCACMVAACGGNDPVADPNPFIFNPVDTSFVSSELKIPAGKFKYVVLYKEGEEERVDWKNTMAPAKGMHDGLIYVPINGSSTHGILWVNHASTDPQDAIGDGGGASVIEVYRDSLNGWGKVGFAYSVNFESVGGTLRNGQSLLTPWGTILSSEAIEPSSNRILQGPDSLRSLVLGDTSELNGLRRWMNYGWMVEVDPLKREVLGKRKMMGRFVHGGNAFLADQKTFFMLDDAGPGAFFKFVADTAGHVRNGQLYAYRHVPDSLGSYWIKLSRGRDTLSHARRIAFQQGATIFNHLHGIAELPDGSFLLSETGQDSLDITAASSMGGKLAPHLEALHQGNKRYHDKHGRLLRFDPKTQRISVFLEGGQAKEDKSIILSNPGHIAIDRKRGLLVIQEVLNGSDGGRIPPGTGVMVPAEPGKPAHFKAANEIYFLDLKIVVPKLDDLHRFATIPVGFSSTGATFSLDYSALFINLQQDEQGGVPPFDRSMTVVISGFGE